MPRLAVAALAAALFLAAPAAAQAAQVNMTNGVLTYTAQAGATNRIALTQTGSDTVTSTLLGTLRSDPRSRAEFFALAGVGG